ncbi:MAG: hypothetical protein AAFU73_23055 [Planctomycetota bacterium]
MDTPAITITHRQLEVLEYVASFREGHGVSPTLTEVGAFLGVSKSTARDHVLSLRIAGALGSNDAGLHRALYVTEAGQAHLERFGRTA